MLQITITNRSQLVTVAAAICAAGFIATPTTTHADPTGCNQWAFVGNKVSLHQSNGFTVSFTPSGLTAQGNAGQYDSSGNLVTSGNINGGIQGGHLDFTISWDNGTRGHYTGDIGDDLQAHGKTVDLANRGSSARWDTTTVAAFECTTPAAPVQPVPVQPIPAQQAPAQKATVTNDVDVYNIAHGDDPDANGVQGVKIGMLRAGQQVGLAGSCQPNDWCHILAPGLPNGSGFIWGNLQF